MSAEQQIIRQEFFLISLSIHEPTMTEWSKEIYLDKTVCSKEVMSYIAAYIPHIN